MVLNDHKIKLALAKIINDKTYYLFPVKQGHRLRHVLGVRLLLHPKLHHGLRLHQDLLRGPREGTKGRQGVNFHQYLCACFWHKFHLF